MYKLLNHRFLKGIGANVYGQFLNVCIQLAGVPILLYYWGGSLYGEWLILSAVPTYLSMTDLGFAQSAGNDMTQQVARNDLTGANSVFQSIGLLIFLCSLGGLALTAGLLSSIALTEILPIQLLSNREAAWIIGLLAGDVLIMLNEGTLHAGFRSGGGYALHTIIDNTTRMVQYLLLWISAAIGEGPVFGAAAFLCVRIIQFPLTSILMLHKYPWISIGIGNANLLELRRLFKPAIANLASPLAYSLNIQGMRLVVGAILGPIAVVIFTTLRTLARLITQVNAIILHSSEPEMAAAYGNRETGSLRRIFIHTTQLTIILTIGIAFTLYWSSDWILDIWTQGKVSMDHKLFRLLLASAVASTFWRVGLIILKAANRHLRAAVFFCAVSGLAVAMAYGILVITSQLSNVGFVLLLMDISISLYIIPIAYRLTDDCWKQFFKRLINPHYLILTKPNGNSQTH